MNIVVLMLDTLRPDHLGFLGNDEIKTPNLDEFAKDSITFSRAYAEYPNTIPARTCFVSGDYTFPCRPWQPLEPEDLHVAEIMRDASYHTAALSDTPFNNGANMDRGFDEFRHFPTGKCLPPADGRPIADFSEAFFPDGYPEKEVLFYGKTKTNRQICLEKYGMTPGEYFFSEVSEWLQKAPREPFFLWVDSFQPHEPWDAAEPYRSMYEPRYGHNGRYLPMPMAPNSQDWMKPKDVEHVRALYKASVTETDDLVAGVFETLNATGLYEDTAVFIVSDHGMPLCEHGLLRKFGYPVYDELARITWMMRLPDAADTIDTPKTIPALVSNVDFLPTLLDLCDLTIDAPLPGHNLLPLIDGDRERVRQKLFLGAYNYRAAVRTETHKFIDNRGEKPNELYDLTSDPAEQNNLHSTNGDLAGDLHRQLWKFHAPWRVKHSRHHDE